MLRGGACSVWLVVWVGCVAGAAGLVLASVDCVDGTETNMYAYINPVGLSFTMPEVINLFNETLFRSYLLNSNIYGDWYSNFQVTIHTPVGYKYNCSLVEALYPNTTTNCTYDMDNSSFITTLGDFGWNVTNGFGMNVGIDPQDANYTDTNYMTNSFAQFIYRVLNQGGQYFNAEVAFGADTWAASGFKANYSASQPVSDCTEMNNYVYLYFQSPGLTQNASSTWWDQMGNICYYCGMFSLQATIFPNASECTVANLLSDTYTYQFINNRLSPGGVSYVNQVYYNLVTISDLRLVDDYAATGSAANTFAAAIWAIDFVMEWIIVGGFRADFFSPVEHPSLQSILGQSPLFGPSAIYGGLLLSLIANYQAPYIIRPIVTAGSSTKIKAYGLDFYTRYGVLILNKDTNPAASGTVQVKISYFSGMNCMYLEASSLDATTGWTLGGLQFGSNSAVPTGNYTEVWVDVDNSGFYNIPLGFAQVVFCSTVEAKDYYYFPRGSAAAGAEWVQVCLLLLLLCWLLL